MLIEQQLCDYMLLIVDLEYDWLGLTRLGLKFHFRLE